MVFVASRRNSIKPAKRVNSMGHRIFGIGVHIAQEVLHTARYGSIRRDAVITVDEGQEKFGGGMVAVTQHPIVC